MGMLVDKNAIGFGKRSWRYSMVVNDGVSAAYPITFKPTNFSLEPVKSYFNFVQVIEKMFIEPEVEGDPFEVSDADTMLKYLNPDAKPIV